MAQAKLFVYGVNESTSNEEIKVFFSVKNEIKIKTYLLDWSNIVGTYLYDIS